MPLTQEEIAAIQPLLEGNELNHEALKPLQDLGLIIRTPKAEEEFKTNYFNQEYSKKEASAYSNLQNSIKELTGVEMLPNEKASAYAERALAADKQARSALATELETLRTEKAAGSGNTSKDARIQQLETLLATEKENYTNELTKKEQEKLDIKVSAQAETALAAIRSGLKKSIDASVQDDVMEARQAKLAKQYTPRQNDKGVIEWIDSEGNVVNHPTTFKPLTTKELYSDFFKDLLEEKKEQGGAGSGKSGQGKKEGGAAELPEPGAEVDTLLKLTDYLKEHGLATGTKEFKEAFDKYKAGKKLR